jgi:hypothetical protein
MAWPIIVDLVRAGVVEVFALEVDLRAAHFAAHARGVVDGRGTADEVGQLVRNSARNSGSFWYLA